MFLVLLTVSVGTWAANFTWPEQGEDPEGTYTGLSVTASNLSVGNVGDIYQKLVVSGPGALVAFINSTKDYADGTFGGPLKGVGGSETRVNLQIEGELNAADLAALKSANAARLGTFTSLDLKRATISNTSDVSGIAMSNLKYLRLPSNFETVESMSALSTSNNPNLEVALSTDAIGNSANKIVVNSYKANGFRGCMDVFIDGYNNGYNGFYELKTVKYVTMSGEFGDKDLVDNGNLFGTPAVWDFTGAHFADMTLPETPGANYYNYDDPFCDYAKVPTSTQTNAFYYFNSYARKVVDIKLPDKNMTHLPYHSISYLASDNKENYMAINGVSEEDFNQTFGTPHNETKYFDENNNEFPGTMYPGGTTYQEGEQLKGRYTETCETDLTEVTPTTESAYTNTWADNKSFPINDLTVTDGSVTPAEFLAKLNRTVSVKTPGGYDLTNETYKFYQGNDGYYYLYDWALSQVGGESITATTALIVTETFTIAYNGSTFTPTEERPATEDTDGNWYGTIDNPGNVSFNVTTNYIYTFTDCFDRVQTITSEGQPLSSYTASKEIIIDLTARDVEVYGTASYAPIETLVIPNCYTDLDEECGDHACIKHLVVGSGVKRVHGGAFLDCTGLEDLDFAAGISDCYLGDRAFHGQQNSVMKHIALSEGIVSLGYQCFQNAQHLESIRLPQTLINIGNEAFLNCLALNSITIPENVDKIGQKAFGLCPFTDIYLTTTDPEKIPIVWSAGTDFFNGFDGNCTFNHGHIDGWEGGVDAYENQINNVMTWEEAAEFYFINWNGLPVLHFPEELADKVRSYISSQYAMKTKADENGKQYGLPKRVDMDRRDDIPGADLGSAGQGKYTRDGWAQFLMMKEYTTDPGGDVYSKEYDDVWYTMCFPFDLTDEQLASAFNETFNIVDFSGVEVTEETETDPLTLTLHFNTVAKTYYRDNDGNEYEVIGREKDGNYNYNIYRYNGQEYHHVTASDKLTTNKTKTFAPGSSLDDAKQNKDQARFIDGYLATAGHPYMIHPAIGVNDGGTTKKRCDFSGITWKPQTDWASIFEEQKREVDLGVAKGSFTGDDINDHSTWTPDADNYMQPAYSKYKDQTYTFIGNSKEYRDDAQTVIGDEPQVPNEPIPAVKPSEEEVEALKPSVTLEEPHATVDNPETNTKYSDEFKELFTTVRCSYTGWNATTQNQNHLYEFTFGEDLITYEWQEFFTNQDYYNNQYGPWYLYNKTRSNGHNVNGDGNNVVMWNLDALEDYLGEGPLKSLNGFNDLKQLAVDYQTDKAAWAEYQSALSDYITNRAEWAYYNAQREILDNWVQSDKDQEYQDALTAYNNAVTAHNAWLDNAKKWKTYIPKNAYFLGRKSNAYPKYYREIAENPADGAASTRQGGVWTQFTAVIIPNDAAINGIEKKLGPGIANNTKALNMVFDEGFMGEFNPTDIKEIVAEAEEKGQKVEYMNIVYSINGEVVGRGSHSLNNLPQGMYIINGKKYLVK